METWDAITARRNVREFADRAIPDEDLDRVLEAGRIAPSSQNNQPWDFVVVTDLGKLSELSGVWRGGGHIAHAAAAIALVIGDEEEPRVRERNRFDVGQATMQMMIAAADRGIGTGHSAVGDQDLARSVLGVPHDKLVAFVMDLGYPAERPLRPGTRLKRRPFGEVVPATAGDAAMAQT
jgi:nitroreductase